MTNTKLLNDKITKSGLKRNFIAEKLGLSYYGLKLKIDNENEFKASEISALCDLLNIKTVEEKESIFFTNKVDYKSTKVKKGAKDE